MIAKYFHSRWKVILLYFFIILTYLCISFLYPYDNGPILYASQILGGIGIVIFFLDYYAFQKKYKHLKKLEETPSTISSYLVESTNEIEKEYQNLLTLLNQQFIEYQNNIDSKTSERNDYFDLWAHEIKTPIAAMHLLLDDTDFKDLKEQLFHLEEYVSMAMGYIRADSVSNDFVIKKYNIEDICKACVRHYSPLFIRKKLSLTFKPFHYEIVTDEKWLSFVIGQILSNALKYTEKGSISIYMKQNDLIIEDTGIGISESDLPRIFEKNYTGENGHKNSSSSGMGLYLCKLILEKLSHSIHITSKVNSGTQVIISFSPYNNVRNI